MLTGKRFWTLAVVFGLCVLATAGCRRKSSKKTTINGSSIFTTDDFPGAPVQDGNVADDQRALSEAGINVDNTGDIRVFFNGDRDIAMVVYATGSGGSGGGDNAMIHYYDGVFRPGVQLTSAVDLTDAGWDWWWGSNDVYTSNISVAWINTDENGSSAAEARDGDAIIHWIGSDFASGGGDGTNASLFSTYFCRDFADDENHITAGGTEYRRGFDKFARRVDVEDGPGENVNAHGLISDGLCGEARWTYYGSEYRWGDQTSQIVVFWNQYTDNSVANDPVTYWARYPLDSATPEDDPIVPTAPSKLAIATSGASDTGVDSHETQIDFGNANQGFITYNFTIFQRVAADDSATPDFSLADDDDDVYICTNTFNAAGTDFLAVDIVHTVLPDATDFDENQANMIDTDGFLGTHSTFGPDEGLLEIVFLHTQTAEVAGGAGTLLNSGDLVLSQIDPTTGQDIGDKFLDVEQSLIFDPVSSGSVKVAMSRNGDYLFIAWLETVDSGASDETGVWVAHYRTSRDSVVGIAPVLSVTTTGINVNTDIDGDGVNWFKFQEQLGYVCGLQSDAEVMNLFFEQSDGFYDEVSVVRLTADLSLATAVFTAGPDTVAVTDDDNGVLGYGDFMAVDSGEGGNFFCSFERNVDTAAVIDIQLFSLRTGVGAASGRIDSNWNFRTSNLDSVLATPSKQDIGVFGEDSDDERAAPAEIVHTFFYEDEMSENNNDGVDALRTRAFYTNDGSALSFSDEFVPNLLEYPFQISLTQNDDSGWGGPSFESWTTEGDEVCLLFEQMGHLYFQHFSGGDSDGNVSWRVTDNGGDGSNDDLYTSPALVDDDSDAEIDFSDGWWTRTCVCDGCSGAMVFWMKDLDDAGSISGRWQVRVLNSDN